jgi:Uma2 family endonuclease
MIRGIYRMTAPQFRKAIDAGVFGDRRVELLGGVPFIMSENPPHILSASRTYLALLALASLPRWFVNKEHRLELGQWRPLPDVVVLSGPDSVYGTRLAQARDVALLVEVADTSYARDSGPKLRRYASFRIPTYWIVDLKHRRVEVHTQPAGKGKNALYGRCDIYLDNDLVPLSLDGTEVGKIAVAALLPDVAA